MKHIAIIGAGMVGVSTALWLMRDGHRVTLIDKAGPAEGTSYGNAGLLASCSIVPVPTPGLVRKAPGMLFDPNQPLFVKWSYLPKIAPWLVKFLRRANASDAKATAEALMPIIGDSLADHQALAAGTRAEKWIVPCEWTFVYNDRKGYEADQFGWDVRRSHGFECREVEGSAVAEYEPALSSEMQFAVRCLNHGRILDPGRYIKDLAAEAEANGLRIIKANVDDIVRENGKVTGIRAGGETIDCDAAVIATGAWSGPLCAKLGLNVPLETERGYHIEYYDPSIELRNPLMVSSGKFAITPMQGRIRAAGVVELGGLEKARSKAPFELLRRKFAAALPGLKYSETKEWMGHRPTLADSIPVIGELPDVKGAFTAFGHHHVGLTGGPKTGRLLAQVISGKTPNIDMTPYKPSRFR